MATYLKKMGNRVMASFMSTAKKLLPVNVFATKRVKLFYRLLLST